MNKGNKFQWFQHYQKPFRQLEPSIILDGVHKYSGSLTEFKEVLTNFTLTLYKGEITFLVGRNGSGKTAIFEMLMGNKLTTNLDENLFLNFGSFRFFHLRCRPSYGRRL